MRNLAARIIIAALTFIIGVSIAIYMAHRSPKASLNGKGSSEQSEKPDINDKALLGQVMLFSSESDLTEYAWEQIKSYPRQDLIDALARIRQSLPEDDRDRVFIAFTLCNLDYEYQANRQIVVSALSKEPRYADFYGDWSASLVMRLIRRGDKDLLPALLDAATWADGAMAEELGGYFTELLQEDQEGFLLALKSRKAVVRQSVYERLIYDLKSPVQLENFKQALANVPADSPASPAAKELLKKLSRIRIETRIVDVPRQ